MSLTTLFNELSRFVKDKAKTIVWCTVLMAIVMAGGRFAIMQFQFATISAEYQSLNERYAQEPAEFQFMMTLEDGTIFDNSYIFDEYFSQSDQVAKVENMTNIKFGDWIKEEAALELFKTSQFRGGLASVRNTSTNIMTFRVLVGKTAEENLAIAQAYHDILEKGELPFVSNQKIIILSQPTIGETLDLLTYTNVGSPDILKSVANPSKKVMAIFFVAGAMFGFMLSVAVLLIMQLRNQKIHYAFEYIWRFDDRHIMIQQHNRDFLTQVLQLQSRPRQVILSESDDMNVGASSTLNHIQDQQSTEIVMIIQSAHTTKQWYKDQLSAIELTDCPLKIIHVLS